MTIPLVRGLEESSDPHAWMVAAIPRAVAYAVTLLNDRAQAEDIVHDCCCRLLRKAKDYNLPRDGLKLMFRSITNACITLNTRERPLLRLESFTCEEHAAPVADRTVCQPDQVAMHEELRRAVGDGLARLQPMQRAAMELTSLGVSSQEVAEALGVSPANARVLVHRARLAMAAFLAPYLGEATG